MFVLVERLQAAVDAVLGLSVIIALLLVRVCTHTHTLTHTYNLLTHTSTMQVTTSSLGCYGSWLIWRYQQYDIL